MRDISQNSLSLEGEGRVRVFDVRRDSRAAYPLTSILSPPGRGGSAGEADIVELKPQQASCRKAETQTRAETGGSLPRRIFAAAAVLLQFPSLRVRLALVRAARAEPISTENPS